MNCKAKVSLFHIAKYDRLGVTRMRNHKTPDEAFRLTIHKAGGVRIVAEKLDMRVGVLKNKADPNKDCNVPTLKDVRAIVALTEDYQVYEALAEEVGGVFIPPVLADEESSNMTLFDLMTNLMRTHGDVARAVDETLADGRVELHEVHKVRREAFRVQQAVTALLMRLEGMAE